MKVFVPMAGMGKRFQRAGYKDPKPLISVDGKTMIEHVVGHFSADDSFVFGVNEEHLRSSGLTGVLKKIAPRAKVVPMPYQPGGVIDVLKIMSPYVEDDEAVVVNYCDFSWTWDYQDFKKTVQASGCDGAVVCYTGFHPHLGSGSLYATLDPDGQWMREIREKHSWNGDQTKDWTSSGTYYFRRGKDLKECLEALSRRTEWKINGEHYASQLFQIMKEKGLRVLIYRIPIMLQWGTPEDLEEYRYWSDYFRAKKKFKTGRVDSDMTLLMLMAGAGKRFADEGYTLPKPLIPAASGLPMVEGSAACLPPAGQAVFVAQKEHWKPALEAPLAKRFGRIRSVMVERVTEGQACTALLAEKLLDSEKPLLIGACDHEILYDDARFEKMTQDPKVDALIFTFRHNPCVKRKPQMYGWVAVDQKGKAARVSVKVPLSTDPEKDHAIIGAFWFRRAKDFIRGAKKMVAANHRVNGEFYIDQCMNELIEEGLDVRIFEVDRYASWGTPKDLKTYIYWQEYFASHAS